MISDHTVALAPCERGGGDQDRWGPTFSTTVAAGITEESIRGAADSSAMSSACAPLDHGEERQPIRPLRSEARTSRSCSRLRTDRVVRMSAG
jgi:hypothetical protein